MRIEKRTIKSTGTHYFSFVRYDIESKKRIRLTRGEVRNRFGRDILTKQDALQCLGQLEAEIDSTKAMFEKRKQWQEKYYRFNELLEDYTKKRKIKAPNSWKNSVYYLSYYVLPYFLDIKQVDNILLWHRHYKDFRYWLETEASLVRKPGQKISYASKNHCVKALNVFMRHLKDDDVITELRLMEAFDNHLLNERTAKDLVSFDEMVTITNKLTLNDHSTESAFHRFLYFTGMRFNEAAGVSFVDLYQGEMKKKMLDNLLKKNGITYYGYIILKSQPSADNRAIRDAKTLEVPRKPLKGRKKICEKNSRIAPITDKVVWDDLVSRAKIQYQNWQKGIYGTIQENYLLFDGINKATSMTRLKIAYEQKNLPCKTWHCLRHSRGTELFGETGDRELCKLWLGHESNRVFERYNHVYEEMVRDSARPALSRKNDFESWFGDFT